MDRKMIERWLQQRDDDILYDADGATRMDDDPWLQHGGASWETFFDANVQGTHTSGLYADAGRVLRPLNASHEAVPLRIALLGRMA